MVKKVGGRVSGLKLRSNAYVYAKIWALSFQDRCWQKISPYTNFKTGYMYKLQVSIGFLQRSNPPAVQRKVQIHEEKRIKNEEKRGKYRRKRS